MSPIFLGILNKILANVFHKYSKSVIGIFILLMMTGSTSAQSQVFSVTTSGGSRIVSTPDSATNCTFPITLTSTVELDRDEEVATKIDVVGDISTFTFNHPVETDRTEIKLRRTVSNCEASFTILELQQPVSQFSLVVTPTVDGAKTDPLVVWEHISLGPLPSEQEFPVESPETPSDPDIIVPSDTPSNFCSDDQVQTILSRIGVLSEEIRIQENRFDDLESQKENQDASAWEMAASLVEARDTATRLEEELLDWEMRLQALVDEQKRNQVLFDEAHETYLALQQEYVDESNVKVVEGEQPLTSLGSGVTLSLDGGQTWLILVGERGLRQFIGMIREDKVRGRELHRRGQEVKRIRSTLFTLANQLQTTTEAISDTKIALENARKTVDTKQQELNSLREQTNNLNSERVDVSDKLLNLQSQLQEEELLLRGCEAFTNQPTSMIQNLLIRIAQFFRPLVLAYGGN